MTEFNDMGHLPHWDDEILGFDMHPTYVSGVGAVQVVTGLDPHGVPVKHIEVWDGALSAGTPVGSAGIKPTKGAHISVLYHARWVLEFTDASVRLQATALPSPAPWGED